MKVVTPISLRAQRVVSRPRKPAEPEPTADTVTAFFAGILTAVIIAIAFG